jgi:sucrose phosphorylase
MKEAIYAPLRRLYGEKAGALAAQEFEALLARFASRGQPAIRPGPDSPLTEADVLLITYADQVREPGAPPLRTLAEFCEARLREMVSGVHVLPFYPWSSDDGFAVKDYLAVDPAFGAWEDVAGLGRSFDLMFDAVFNHLSAQSDWFQRFLRGEPEFRDFFLTVEGRPDLSQVVRPRALPLLTEFQTASGPRQVWTTFSADQADLNYKNPRVLLAVLEALLFYVAQGARFIRLDAIAFLWKEIGTPCLHLPQTHALIQLMRAVLDEVAPRVVLLTETNVPHADNLAYFGDGANEAQLIYNFALPPLVLHALATGNAATLTRWAATLKTPSKRTTFLNFLASHDGIGLNPARGILTGPEIEALVQRTQQHGGLVSYKQNPDGTQSPYELNITWFDAVNDPGSGEPIETRLARFIASQAIMLALAGVPAIYFHSLFGARNDRAGADAAGIPRRINRQKFGRAELERELADPDSPRARVFARYHELLRFRRGDPAFHPHAGQEVLTLDDRVFAVLRTPPEGGPGVLCLHNLSNTSVELRRPMLLNGRPFILRRFEVLWTRIQPSPARGENASA